jgi:hypothetical protein
MKVSPVQTTASRGGFFISREIIVSAEAVLFLARAGMVKVR